MTPRVQHVNTAPGTYSFTARSCSPDGALWWMRSFRWVGAGAARLKQLLAGPDLELLDHAVGPLMG